MSTGLLIRDFDKNYRELRYSSSGSIRFSEIEHNAYRLALTLEVTHVDAPRYGNKKTLPDNTHYGYVTTFKGSTVTDSISIKYPKFRVFDIINSGIWLYHQNTEAVQVDAGVVEISANTSSNGVLGKLGDWLGGAVCFFIKLDYSMGGGGPTSDFLLEALDCDSGEAESESLAKKYRAFPIASPFPDVVKFKADLPCSFLWRLEQWYLVNPAVYIADNPTDTGDETEDEDEYPEPEKGDGDGDGSEFPDSDEPDPNSDSRDFPEIGGGDPDAPGVTNIIGYFVAYGNPVTSVETGSYTVTIMQVPGRATAGDVSYSCNQVTPPSYAAAGKCFDFDVTCFGVSTNIITTIESLDFSVQYFENGA
jgi:hypothetical protein